MKGLFILGVLFAFLVSASDLFASSELQARKDIAALNKPFTNQQFMDSIYGHDELVVKLFVDAKHDLNFVDNFQRHLLTNIPTNVLQYFNQTGGGGYDLPPQYHKYQLAWFDAVKLSGLSGTPLMLAVFVKDESIVRLLIQAGADVNFISKYQSPGTTNCDTALSLAVKGGDAKIVSLLLEVGANPATRCDMDIINSAFNYLLERNSKADKTSVITIAKDLDKHKNSSFYTDRLKRAGRL